MIHETMITKDVAAKKLHVTREFSAPLDKVWKAWTESELLDKWWAPKPWRAETKSMDFSEGGFWLYSMVGPNGERQYCKVDFKKIVPEQQFSSVAIFCDEDGKRNNDFPSMYWSLSFSASTAGTKVVVELNFDTEADMQQIVVMGFEAGFTMGLGNLDELLAE